MVYPNGIDCGTPEMEIDVVYIIDEDGNYQFVIAKPRGYFNDGKEDVGERDSGIFIVEETTLGELMAEFTFDDESCRADKCIKVDTSVKEKVLHPKIKNKYRFTSKDKVEKVKEDK